MWGDIATSFLLAFIVTFMATPYTIKIAHKVGAVDIPNEKTLIPSITASISRLLTYSPYCLKASDSSVIGLRKPPTGRMIASKSLPRDPKSNSMGEAVSSNSKAVATPASPNKGNDSLSKG